MAGIISKAAQLAAKVVNPVIRSGMLAGGNFAVPAAGAVVRQQVASKTTVGTLGGTCKIVDDEGDVRITDSVLPGADITVFGQVKIGTRECNVGLPVIGAGARIYSAGDIEVHGAVEGGDKPTSLIAEKGGCIAVYGDVGPNSTLETHGGQVIVTGNIGKNVKINANQGIYVREDVILGENTVLSPREGGGGGKVWFMDNETGDRYTIRELAARQKDKDNVPGGKGDGRGGRS